MGKLRATRADAGTTFGLLYTHKQFLPKNRLKKAYETWEPHPLCYTQKNRKHRRLCYKPDDANRMTQTQPSKSNLKRHYTFRMV
jgi:hypothetical protein